MTVRISIASNSSTFLSVLAACAIWPAGLSGAESGTDDIAVLRNAYASGREAFIAQHLQLMEEEARDFWPIYAEYRIEREKLGDSLVKLLLEHADMYPEIPEDRAAHLFKSYLSLEEDFADQRTKYLKRFARKLPASKALRLAQLENRLDLDLRLQLASVIPMTPIAGELTGVAMGATAVAPGVPGGIAVETHELTAKVIAIDKVTRKLTLLGPDGIKQTVKVGPEAINFDQIRLGDQLNITVTGEVVIYVAGEGASTSDGAAQLVALAPEGAKPGGILAEATLITAKVTAINAENHTATLQFEDGSTRAVAVRPDVDLSTRKVGEKVVIRITEAVVINVEKP